MFCSCSMNNTPNSYKWTSSVASCSKQTRWDESFQCSPLHLLERFNLHFKQNIWQWVILKLPECLILNWTLRFSWVTVSCLMALLWISCYASQISHLFALIPSLSTSHQPTQVQLPPVSFVFLFIYATVTKKILKYSTVNILPPPETSESPEKQSQDTRRLPEQISHQGERPAGVLPTCWAPGCQSAHITSSIHQCLVAFVPPVSLSPPVSFMPQKLRIFHNLWTFLQSDALRCV